MEQLHTRQHAKLVLLVLTRFLPCRYLRRPSLVKNFWLVSHSAVPLRRQRQKTRESALSCLQQGNAAYLLITSHLSVYVANVHFGSAELEIWIECTLRALTHSLNFSLCFLQFFFWLKLYATYITITCVLFCLPACDHRILCFDKKTGPTREPAAHPHLQDSRWKCRVKHSDLHFTICTPDARLYFQRKGRTTLNNFLSTSTNKCFSRNHTVKWITVSRCPATWTSECRRINKDMRRQETSQPTRGSSWEWIIRPVPSSFINSSNFRLYISMVFWSSTYS